MNILNLLNKALILFILIFTPYLVNHIASIKHNDFLVFIDVGQGDSTLACTKYSQCGLIDTGKQTNVVDSIKAYTTSKLEFLILTHPDADHISKTLDIVKKIGIKSVLITRSLKSEELIADLTSLDVPIFEIRDKNDFKFGEFYFDVLWPDDSLDVNSTVSNETSTTILINNRGHDFYLAGDLGIEYEELIQQRNQLQNVKVAKISHHGSKNSSSTTFLKNMNPSVSVISVGGNSYGHPSKEVLKRLDDLNIDILRTDVDGDVRIYLSEEKLEITTQNTKKSYIILN